MGLLTHSFIIHADNGLLAMAQKSQLAELRGIVPDNARIVSNIINGEWDEAVVWTPEELSTDMLPDGFEVENQTVASGEAPAVTVNHPHDVNKSVAGQKKYVIVEAA